MEASLLRPLLALAALCVATTPLAAAPLCRDTKGLFTPCPRDNSGRIAKTPVDNAASAAYDEEKTAAHAEKRKRHHAEHPNEPDKPDLISRGKLCHDTKGLFTPCPR